VNIWVNKAYKKKSLRFDIFNTTLSRKVIVLCYGGLHRDYPFHLRPQNHATILVYLFYVYWGKGEEGGEEEKEKRR
jgi:hypothetical protein